MRTTTLVLGSVGRQSYLVSAFREALGHEGSVVAYDYDPLAPALGCASISARAPAFDTPAFGPWLLDLCRRTGADALITLSAEELDVLEGMRDTLASVSVKFIGTPAAARAACRDKLALDDLCSETGFATVPSWQVSQVDDVPADAYPIVVKPRRGRGSRGLERITNGMELETRLINLAWGHPPEEFIAQPALDGIEFGLDLVNDLEGVPRAVLLRRKLRMRGGETDIASTCDDDALTAKGMALARRIGHQGLIDVDVIVTGAHAYVIDVNPRFGGGYVFSHWAGADVPRAIVAWLQGRAPDEAWLRPEAGRTFARVTTLQELDPEAPTRRGPTEGYEAEPDSRGGA